VPAVILDTSVTVAWLLPDEPLHRQAVALRDQIVAGTMEPVVASHHRFELRHALVRAAQRHRCGWHMVPGLLGDIDEMELEVAPGPDSDGAILALCETLRLTWADGLWVWLAMRRDVPLVTADMGLVRAVPSDLAWIESLGDQPI